MHPALKTLSYSSSLTLHACPRKYEIYRCSPRFEKEENNVDYAFGAALGAGIQALLCEQTMQQAIWQASLAWKAELYASIDKTQKSFWYVVFALKKFDAIAQSILREWRVAEFDGKPAIELSFKITNSEDFNYLGFVDVVLINRHNLELMVIEIKSTGSKSIAEASYRNSGQAIGYSIVLDAIAKQLKHLELASAFKVMYIVYSSTTQEFQPFPFPKHRNHRARWIVQLVMDWEQIKLYDKYKVFPMHGENCYDFFKPCQYLGICEMSNAGLGFVSEEEYTERKRKEQENGEGINFTFNLSLQEIIDAQLGT